MAIGTNIYADDSAAPTAPTSWATYAAKTPTTAFAAWDDLLPSDTWTASPSIAAVIQELADSYDPSAIQILHKDDGSGAGQYQSYASYGFDTGTAPKLNIDYTAAAAGDLNVLDGVTSIPDGQVTPVSFGSIVQGGSAPQKTFTIENLGDLTISITSITVPTGYEIDAGSDLDGGADTIAGGTSKDLVVNLLTASVGTKTGDITINSDDGDEGTYNFAVTGTVAPASLGNPSMLLMGVG